MRLLAVLFAVLSLGQGPGGQPRLDMTADEARAALGDPPRVSRQIFAHRCLEQWHFPAPRRLRLVFDCPRGQPPRLVAIEPGPAFP